jgi:hypothetical protein
LSVPAGEEATEKKISNRSESVHDPCRIRPERVAAGCVPLMEPSVC